MRLNRYLFPLLIGITLFLFVSCGGPTTFEETFDEPGNWRVDAEDPEVRGEVKNGVYDFFVIADELTIWTTAGQNFSDGMYEVEATQVDGPNNNAYGMIFRVNDNDDNFYAFLISGDGFAWIGTYKDGVVDAPIVTDWWFESPAIIQGSEATNKLGVRAEGANLQFFINDQEVGRVTDNTFNSGDIGLMARSLGQGGVHVQFDNFTIDPLE